MQYSLRQADAMQHHTLPTGTTADFSRCLLVLPLSACPVVPTPQLIAEAWLKQLDAMQYTLRRTDADWRDKPMSDNQASFLVRHSIPHDASWTRGRAGAAMDAHVLQVRLGDGEGGSRPCVALAGLVDALACWCVYNVVVNPWVASRSAVLCATASHLVPAGTGDNQGQP